MPPDGPATPESTVALVDPGRADGLDATVAAPAGGATVAAPMPAMIGRYQIVRVLGRGGMGTVYAAHDPELGREVALKSLHARDHGDLLRAERLRREAQALARVVHPNVVAVHDAGISDGTPFLVMQRIDGETLDDHLRRVPRSTAEILALFVQIGRGLQAIHDAGLVHRDIKPTNVLVDRHGVPHVSDLGLARIGALEALEPAGAGASSSSGTLTRGGAGTPAYMAPEQYEAREPTAACDQFSFCVTLWEALYGVRPFAGMTSEEVQARIRRGDLRTPGDERRVPAAVTRALRRGLAHAPEARFPSMTALLEALRPPRRIGAIAAGAGVALAVGAAWLLTRGGDRAAPEAAPAPVLARPAAERAVRVTFADACEEYPSFSPDGATIYFDGQVGEDYHLFALDVATGVPRELTHTAGWDYASEVSPDGRRIAFIRVDDAGSQVHVGELDALDATRPLGSSSMHPTWSPDGAGVWTAPLDQLVRHDPATGAPTRQLTVPDQKTAVVGLALADGRFVLLAASAESSGYADTVYLYGAGSAAPAKLIEGSSFEEVLALAPEGDAVWIAEVTPAGGTELLRLPLAGGPPTSLQGAGVEARKHLAIAAGPGRVAWSDCVVHTGLATVTTVGGEAVLVDLPHGNWADAYPETVPGTARVLFVSERADGNRIWQLDRARPGPVERVPFGDLQPVRFAISPDGATLAVSEGTKGLFVAPIDGSVAPRLLIAERGELSPAFSRDGAEIYFERTDAGAPRIAAISITGGAPRWVLPAPSFMPAPSPTAAVLAYLSGAGDEVVPMLLDLATGQSRPLPGSPPYPWTGLRWSPDGTRLLLVRSDGILVEHDPATGRELRRLETGTAMLAGVTYAGDELIVGLTRWSGDLWTAPLAR